MVTKKELLLESECVRAALVDVEEGLQDARSAHDATLSELINVKDLTADVLDSLNDLDLQIRSIKKIE